MSKFVLDGYRPINKRWPVYTLNIETKKVDVQWFENQKEGGQLGPQVGMGDFRKIGSWGNKKEGFYALYVDGNSLYLWLDGQCFDLINGEVSISIKRNVDFLLRKRFRIFADGVAIFDCRYSYLDYEDFPDTDIFWYMARSLNNIEGRIRTLILWQDKAQGQRLITDEYIQNLDERVISAVKKWHNKELKGSASQ